MTANVLDISHLTLSIEHKTILQDIDLTIGAGETVALIGESGSGKSTLAQCILGLQPQRSRLAPESRIDFLGEPLPIENDARMRRWRGCSISMIFQDPMSCLNPYLRVGTQILEALKRGSASDEDPHARVLELLEMVDLPEPKQTAGKYPYELSGGQQQRIMIAMALANRPQLLIADEPTSSLDACVQAEILKLLERLQKAFSLSMLFITHNMAAARFLAHRVYVLQHGRIAESGDIAAVFAHPREAYTAELIRAKENLAALEPVACEAQNNASPVGELSNVSYAYPAAGFCRRAQPTLKDISLRIYPGETLGILGESGSGKSTIAKLLAGLVQPSQGKVSLFEEDISRTRKMALALRKRCQIVFQNPFGALNPRLTVEAALREPLELMNLESHAEERIREALQSVSLPEDFLARYPHELSGGMRKRVAMAQTMIADPDILLMDESFSALDIQTRQLMENELLELWQAKKKAVLFITHDLDEAIAMSDRVVVMSAGPASHPLGSFPIAIPRPRNVAEIRTRADFNECYSAIWEVLREEVLKSYREHRAHVGTLAS